MEAGASATGAKATTDLGDLQPTLSDREQLSRKLRVSLVQNCNFECFFCHNEGQQSARAIGPMSIEEIVRLCRAAVDAGISEIKLTGGEPLLYKHVAGDIVDLVAALGEAREGRCVGLSITTNGLLLGQMAEPLRVAGLDRVTVSLHTLRTDTLRRTAYRNATDSTVSRVIEGLQASARAGLAPLKVNTVLFGPSRDAPGNLDEIPDVVRICRESGVRELRFYTLLAHQQFRGAAFAERYRFWDAELLSRVARALAQGPREAEAIAGAGERFVARWADVLYPKPTLRLEVDDLIVSIEAMRDGRFAHQRLSAEGAYALRLSAHGTLSGTLGASHSTSVLTMMRSGADDRALTDAFATARRELLPEAEPVRPPTHHAAEAAARSSC